jgi:hypothetical protein
MDQSIMDHGREKKGLNFFSVYRQHQEEATTELASHRNVAEIRE